MAVKGSMSAIIRNDSGHIVTLVSNGSRYRLNPGSSTSSIVPSRVMVQSPVPVAVRGPDGRVFDMNVPITMAGPYVVMESSPLRDAVDRVLACDCPYDMNPYPYAQSQCEYQKYRDVMDAISLLNPAQLNEVVETMVPGQGWKPITLLEASIIMRNVPLVAYLLANGANPNVTSTGIPLTQQLCPMIDQDPALAEIMQLLLRAGAPPIMMQW